MFIDVEEQCDNSYNSCLTAQHKETNVTSINILFKIDENQIKQLSSLVLFGFSLVFLNRVSKLIREHGKHICELVNALFELAANHHLHHHIEVCLESEAHL